jgi:hypothetical protein
MAQSQNTVEAIYKQLLSKTGDVIVSARAAATIWDLFKPALPFHGGATQGGSPSSPPGLPFGPSSSRSSSDLSSSSAPPAAFDGFQARAFLQAAMMYWIDATAQGGGNGGTQTVALNLMGQDLVKSLVGGALTGYYRNRVGPVGYLSVPARNAIAHDAKSYFEKVANGMVMR